MNENTYLGLFKSIWSAPAGKQVVAILLILPIAIILFFNYYYSDLISSLREEIKNEKIEHKKSIATYVQYVNDCDKKLQRNDSINVARFNEYRDKVEKQNQEISRQWQADYKETLRQLMETKRINQQTTVKLKQLKK